jgi:hypothetical protein
MRKKYLIFILVSFYYQVSLAQEAGVNTGTLSPGVVFQINSTDGGFLMPRVALTSRDVLAPITGTPVTGLTVYNTATAGTSPNNVVPGIYYWNVTQNRWLPADASKSRDIVKYKNTNTSINFNANDLGTAMPIFATLNFNQNTSLFQRISDSQLRITETGLYRLTLNLDMSANSDQDVFGIKTNLSGVGENVFVGTVENDASGSTSTISKAFSIYMPIPTGGATLQLLGYRINGAADIMFKSSGTSSVVIERIK